MDVSLRLHADLLVLKAQGAGTYLLFDPRASGPPGATFIVESLSISTDTASRIVVGTADQDGQRIRSGSFAANGGMSPNGICWVGTVGTKVYAFIAVAANVDLALDGYYIPMVS